MAIPMVKLMEILMVKDLEKEMSFLKEKYSEKEMDLN